MTKNPVLLIKYTKLFTESKKHEFQILLLQIFKNLFSQSVCFFIAILPSTWLKHIGNGEELNLVNSFNKLFCKILQQNTFACSRLPILTLDPTTYQSFWSRHMLQKVIDQKNHAGDMPYFSEDELYDFQLDVNTYYRVYQSELVETRQP